MMQAGFNRTAWRDLSFAAPIEHRVRAKSRATGRVLMIDRAWCGG
jgi:hypothetical protein